MKVALLIFVVVLGMVAVGAGAASITSWGDSTVNNNWNWRSISVTYHGRTLNCVEFHGSDPRETGISCDWVVYHKLAR
jgi:hypothetical protein